MLIITSGTEPNETEAFKANAPPQGTCDNFLNILKLLTNLGGKQCSRVVETDHGSEQNESHR